MKIASTFEHTITRVFDYEEYEQYIEARFEEGQTTGEGYPDSYLDYTKMNLYRMKRLDKTAQLNAELTQIASSLQSEIRILVITEGWCGDSAQNLPVFGKLEQASKGNITLEFIMRDDNLEVMDEFLTNGGRSIPKAIFMDKTSGVVLGEWGPRPKPVMDIVMQNKETGAMSKEEQAFAIQKWYNQDKTETLQSEIISIFKEMGA